MKVFNSNKSSSSVRARALTTASTIAIATCSLLGGHSAYAGEAQSAATLEEVIVTGSRIAREGYEAPTPLTVMNVEAIENSANANMAEAMKDMPLFSGNATPTSSQGGVSNGNAGLNILNLRGIGAGRTLNLLDGHRTVGSNADGAVDLNTFPQMLVARVDIVTGGVSAVYGSDAVAGVANFILDKTYTGVKGEVSGGVTSYGDDRNYKIGLAAGFPFAGGRGHVLVSGEQVDKTGILNGSNGRQWDLEGKQSFQNPAYVAANCSATALLPNCQPFYISSNHVGMSTTSAGGIITSGPLKGTAFGPGGVPYQFGYGSVYNAPLMVGGDWATQMTAPFYASIDNKESRQAVFLNVAYDVTDNVNVYAQASWNHAFTLGTTLPRLRQGAASTNAVSFLNNTATSYNKTGSSTDPTVIATPGLASGVPWPGSTNGALTSASNEAVLINSTIQPLTGSNQLILGLRADNAFIPAEVRGKIPAGTTLLQFGSWAIDLPLVSTENEHWVNRNVLGATGDFNAFDKDWSWDLYFQHGYSRNTISAGGGITNEVRWAQATDAVRDAATGRVVCRSTLTNPNDGCVPFNVIGIGVNSAAAIDYVTQAAKMYQKLTQDVVAGTVSGEPFDLWAGPVSLALNVEHRIEKVGGTETNDDFYNNTFSGNYHATHGKYSVSEAAFELIVPLAKGQAWADNWDLSLAARATDYSTSGYVTTWKVGTTYTPIPDIKLRVTRSRDIRAPNLADLFLPSSFGRGNLVDPFSGTTHQSNTYNKGNPNLKPEKGDTLGIGLVLQPTFLPGLSLSADYWNIKIKDAIGSIGSATVAQYCFEGKLPNYLDYCSQIKFLNPFTGPGRANFVTDVDTYGYNIAKTLDRGFDFDATYRMGLDELVSAWAGTLTLSGNMTLYLKSYSNNGLSQPTESSGQNNGGQPRWRLNMNANYNLDPIRIGFTARGVSAGTINNSWIVCSAGTCPLSTSDNRTISSTLGGTLTGEANRIPGRFYFDMSASYKFALGDAAEADAFLNIKNLANSDPVTYPLQTGTPHSTHPSNSGLYDYFGRVFRAGVRFRM